MYSGKFPVSHVGHGVLMLTANRNWLSNGNIQIISKDKYLNLNIQEMNKHVPKGEGTHR
jgi:UDP-N-acetylglucosamine pyrophosphorylase